MKLATRQMIAALAKKVAKLVLIEALLPGGTLVVLAILLAGWRAPGFSEKLGALPFFRVPTVRPRHREDLVAYYALRSIR